jgi:acyl-[acyl-carrier-protein]-phospholipid O-acyltransferase/long-chain-fatty-acid--[acyl-carrier-protein] ligase
VPGADGVQPGTRAGSVGRTLPGVSIRIVDPETFAPVPHGEQGLLLVNSPSRMARYFGDSGKTNQVLRDGFYITGDLGYVDEDGFVFITDRLSRFSKIGGEMVPHLKIEEAANEIFAASNCFVTGAPVERRGERLVLLYTEPDITSAQIIERLNGVLPPLWVPKRENVYLVDTIPVLGTGKLDLAKARALAMAKLQNQAPATAEVIAST